MGNTPIVAALIGASVAILGLVVTLIRDGLTRRGGYRRDACEELQSSIVDLGAALFRYGLEIDRGLSGAGDQLYFDVPPPVSGAVERGRLRFRMAVQRIEEPLLVDAARLWRDRCTSFSLQDRSVSEADVEMALAIVERLTGQIMRRDRARLWRRGSAQ